MKLTMTYPGPGHKHAIITMDNNEVVRIISKAVADQLGEQLAASTHISMMFRNEFGDTVGITLQREGEHLIKKA
jgi:hypothetical protein